MLFKLLEGIQKRKRTPGPQGRTRSEIAHRGARAGCPLERPARGAREIVYAGILLCDLLVILWLPGPHGLTCSDDTTSILRLLTISLDVPCESHHCTVRGLAPSDSGTAVLERASSICIVPPWTCLLAYPLVLRSHVHPFPSAYSY